MSAILNTAAQTIQAGLEKMNMNAQAVATSQGNNPPDTATNIVDIKKAQIQTAAAIAVIKVGDEVLGTVLDEFA